MHIKTIEKKILIDLYKSSTGLQCYTLFTRYGIDPMELMTFITKCEKAELISNNNLILTLTEKGEEFIEAKSNYSISHSRGVFNSIPEKYLGQQVSVSDFYIPNLSIMPKDFINNVDKD